MAVAVLGQAATLLLWFRGSFSTARWVLEVLLAMMVGTRGLVGAAWLLLRWGRLPVRAVLDKRGAQGA